MNQNHLRTNHHQNVLQPELARFCLVLIGICLSIGMPSWAAGADAGGAGNAGKVLADFDKPSTLNMKNQGTSTKVIDTDSGKALKATYQSDEKYPGVHFKAPGDGWDLSKFGGVQVQLTNPAEKGVTAALRVDNPGKWKKEPWNAEKTDIKPGKTKTLKVTFGQSWGGPGFDLNPAAVVQAVVYVERPKSTTTLVIHSLQAFGTPAKHGTDQVGHDGKLFNFDPDFVPAGRIDERGASAQVKGGKLLIAFNDPNENYPSVALLPVGDKWDLSKFQSIQAKLTNRGKKKTRVGLRVDNSGGAKHSNTQMVTVKPGKTKQVKVTFGMSHGSAAYQLDASKVIHLLVFADHPKGEAKVAVDDVKANPRKYPDMPDWLGKRPPVKGDWTQTLDEEFDKPKIDHSVWSIYGHNYWDKKSHFSKDCVSIKDGKLMLTFKKKRGHHNDDPSKRQTDYATGFLTSYGKWTQRYGYFEARVKNPSAPGLWPAFWMMPDRGEGQGPQWKRQSTKDGGMEFDIMEHLTRWGPFRYNIAMHWNGYKEGHKSTGSDHINVLPDKQGFLTVGLLWSPGKAVYYCNGKEVYRWENPRISDVPSYILFTLVSGGWDNNALDDSKLPDDLVIDYVRCWQRQKRANGDKTPKRSEQSD